MSHNSQLPTHIDLTETFVRLYVFLSQYLDRCLDDGLRRSYPEEELQKHLADTRAHLLDIISINPVVRQKVEAECEEILRLGGVCLREGKTKPNTGEQVQVSRAVLKNKVIALSDLLAVFRAV
jgi:hypothetical protein